MLILIILAISAQVFATDNFTDGDDRKIYSGPSFKIWCSLTKSGSQKVGSKITLKTGNLVFFPKNNGTGHLPALVAKDFSKGKEVSELFQNLKSLCKEDFKILPDYINANLKDLLNNQVSLIDFRTYDEVLWEFYEGQFKQDKLKNVCEIRKAVNVKNSWVLTYPQINKGCL